MHLALKVSRLNDKLQEPIYLALELIRGGALHANWYGQRSWSGGPSFGTGASQLAVFWGEQRSADVDVDLVSARL